MFARRSVSKDGINIFARLKALYTCASASFNAIGFGQHHCRWNGESWAMVNRRTLASRLPNLP
jgi:hypothetical protein